jgi:hypothetical protein
MKKIILLMPLLLISSNLLAEPNGSSQQILAMNDIERLAFFTKVIKDSGKSCKAVTKTMFTGSDSYGDDYWNARCHGGGDWVISVPKNINEKTRLMDCAVMEMLKLKCWEIMK